MLERTFIRQPAGKTINNYDWRAVLFLVEGQNSCWTGRLAYKITLVYKEEVLSLRSTSYKICPSDALKESSKFIWLFVSPICEKSFDDDDDAGDYDDNKIKAYGVDDDSHDGNGADDGNDDDCV